MSSTTNQLLIEGSLFSFLVVLVRYSTCNTKIWKSFQLCSEKSRRQCCNKPAVVRDLYLVVHSKYSTTWYLLLTRNQFMQVSAVTKPKSMLQRISITWKDLGAPHYPQWQYHHVLVLITSQCCKETVFLGKLLVIPFVVFKHGVFCLLNIIQ